MTVIENSSVNQLETTCPISHPYPFVDGSLCCATDREDVYPEGYVEQRPHLNPADCDGSVLSFTSQCCENHARIKCPHPHGICTLGTIYNIDII